MSQLKIELIKRTLPQNPKIEVFVPNYKEPILPVNHGGFGWYGLQSYNEQGQLMCHECGVFRESLGTHIKQHGLTARNYKAKYELRLKRSLVSQALINKYRNNALTNTLSLKNINRNNNLLKRKGTKPTLEYLNIHDSCDAQLLRILMEAAKIYGQNLTTVELNSNRGGMQGILQRRFGSINKAKQIAKLIINMPGGQGKIDKQIILEDICIFYRNNGRWPKNSDYELGKRFCSRSVIGKNGGIKTLCQEAQKLLDEQKDRAENIKKIPQIAGKIELQFAGRGRR